MASEKLALSVHPDDRDCIFGAQSKLWRLYRKHGDGRKSWRAVADETGVNVKYVYDLVMYNDVPANKTIRHSLFLPLTLPSERKPKRILPRIGEQDWELVYFKKVGVRK
jgi:hypothetical protein